MRLYDVDWRHRYMKAETNPFVVILFYRFLRIENPANFRDEQKKILTDLGLKGRMLIATEGVNATFEGREDRVQAYIHRLKENSVFADLVIKESAGTGHAFERLEVRVRSEVVTLGVGEFDIEKETAPTISAEDLEKMFVENEDFVVLDLRNDYETAVGKFEKTYDPGLSNFRDLPEKIPELAHLKNKKVVAVCTGGIRCEKATCLLKKEGFTDVVQLKDGIHTYMQKFPGKNFRGSLFVFDNRMVTPVVEMPNRAIIGACIYCGASAESFYSDDSVRPSRKIICCDTCIESKRESLRNCVALVR